MHQFTRMLLTEWRRLGLPFSGENVMIAVSGGADSIGLALAIGQLVKLNKFGNRFTIAHFNHRLRGEQSDEDEAFVLEFAHKHGFCASNSFSDRTERKKSNLEEYARRERYDFLERAAGLTGASIIMTAHTMDDQAETFLLRMLRGSGVEGLGAMSPSREFFAGCRLVRPLLNWAYRKDTERFCRDHRIKFRVDEMNEDERFARVKVRKQLLPNLKEFNPKIVETLCQTAATLRADAEMLSVAAKGRYEELRNADGTLSQKALLEVPEILRSRLVRQWLSEAFPGLRQIGSTHIRAVESLALSPKSGRQAELPGGISVLKKGGKLLIRKTKG
jgi:tRNA(Ile)-lysidine synthase